jgi:hypothetical protein
MPQERLEILHPLVVLDPTPVLSVDLRPVTEFHASVECGLCRWLAANGILCPVAALPALQGFNGGRWGTHFIPGEYSEHPYLRTPSSRQPLRSVDSRLLRHLLYDERERVHEEQLVDDAEQLPTSGTSRHGQVGPVGTAKWDQSARLSGTSRHG